MAHIEFFGDSYQYAHRVLLPVIARPEEWTVHPMMFRAECKCQGDRCPDEPGGGLDLDYYARFLGLDRRAVIEPVQHGRRLLHETLTEDVQPHKDGYLFLDPDTGLTPNGPDPERVSIQQVTTIARARDGNIMLIYDHGYSRGKLPRRKVDPVEVPLMCGTCQERNQGENPIGYPCNRCNAVTLVRRKLTSLCKIPNGDGNAIHCGVVIVRDIPIVCYVWVSTNQDTVEQVRRTLLGELQMPDWRLLACPCGECPAP